MSISLNFRSISRKPITNFCDVISSARERRKIICDLQCKKTARMVLILLSRSFNIVQRETPAFAIIEVQSVCQTLARYIKLQRTSSSYLFRKYTVSRHRRALITKIIKTGENRGYKELIKSFSSYFFPIFWLEAIFDCERTKIGVSKSYRFIEREFKVTND